MASDPLLIDVIVLDESRQSRSLLENGVYGPFLICGESDNDVIEFAATRYHFDSQNIWAEGDGVGCYNLRPAPQYATLFQTMKDGIQILQLAANVSLQNDTLTTGELLLEVAQLIGTGITRVELERRIDQNAAFLLVSMHEAHWQGLQATSFFIDLASYFPQIWHDVREALDKTLELPTHSQTAYPVASPARSHSPAAQSGYPPLEMLLFLITKRKHNDSKRKERPFRFTSLTSLINRVCSVRSRYFHDPDWQLGDHRFSQYIIRYHADRLIRELGDDPQYEKLVMDLKKPPKLDDDEEKRKQDLVYKEIRDMKEIRFRNPNRRRTGKSIAASSGLGPALPGPSGTHGFTAGAQGESWRPSDIFRQASADAARSEYNQSLDEGSVVGTSVSESVGPLAARYGKPKGSCGVSDVETGDYEDEVNSTEFDYSLLNLEPRNMTRTEFQQRLSDRSGLSIEHFVAHVEALGEKSRKPIRPF